MAVAGAGAAACAQVACGGAITAYAAHPALVGVSEVRAARRSGTHSDHVPQRQPVAVTAVTAKLSSIDR